jgi:ArsR family transcriptional regulator, lead/cadmium/zinc/bismuth-responsive transcriptional repressor
MIIRFNKRRTHFVVLQKKVGRPGAAARAAEHEMPDEVLIHALAETFSALSDATRLRLVAALSGRELCVADLAGILALTGSAVSHQLRLLRGQHLVKYRKDGKRIYYTLDDDHIGNLFHEGLRHVQE